MKFTKSAAAVLLAALGATWTINGCNTNGGDQQQVEDERLGVDQAALSDPAQCLTGPTCSTELADTGLVTSVTTQIGCGQFPFVLRRSATTDASTGALTIVEQITRKEDVILVTNYNASGGVVNITVDYGPEFHGIQHAHFMLSGQVVTGEVDGRSIVPMSTASDPNTLAFQDGLPMPKVVLNQNTETAIAQLRNSAAQAPSTCFGPPPLTQAAETASLSSPDMGHPSLPDTTAACFGCNLLCQVNSTACVVATMTGCIVAFPVPVSIVCVIIGTVACVSYAVECLDDCSAAGGDCCPVECGNANEGACCLSNETCLTARQRTLLFSWENPMR